MKIIILTAKCGMGHYQCAKAISEKIKNSPMAHRVDDVDIVDIYEQKSARRAKMFYKIYDLFVDKGNKLYNFSYKQIRKKKDKQVLMGIFDKILVENFDTMMKEKKPDLVISTYSFASELMAAYKDRTSSSIPFITWITDVSPHEGWINDHTARYIVADRSSLQAMKDLGVSESIISIGGIPVSSAFDVEVEKPMDEKKRILIVGGGLGLLPKQKAFYKKLSSLGDVEITVVTGKNKKLYKMLKRNFPAIHTLGYVNNMNELMNEADLLLTKAGGITTFEAIQSEKPMIIFKPFLEQEIHNANYIAAMQIGYVLPSNMNRSKRDVPLIVGILKNDDLLEQMQSNLRQVKETIDDNVLNDIMKTECAV